jgi:hypothetical protein
VSTDSPRPLSPLRPIAGQDSLKITRYERVASLVLALLILVGFAVTLLFMLWLTSSDFSSSAIEELTWCELGDSNGLAIDTELETDVDGFAQQAGLDGPELQCTLATIAEAVTAKAALIQQPLTDGQTGAEKEGPAGDDRLSRTGPPPGGARRHWEVTFFDGNTVETYARQLDFFRIELGVLFPENRVKYAWNLSRRKPKRRSGPADQEQRYYLTWQKGQLRQADHELLEKAGIRAGTRPILKFIPPELEGELARLEQQRAGESGKRIRATYFAIRPKGRGYEFYVRDQTYRY